MKQYSKCCKIKCKEFKNLIIEKLDNLFESDPNAHWKWLNEDNNIIELIAKFIHDCTKK